MTDAGVSLTRERVSGHREAPARRRRLFPYLIIMPGLAYYALFTIYPIVSQFRISFYDWNIVPGVVSPFVGLSQYAQVLGDAVVLVALRNTALYTVVTVPAQIVLGLGVASLLNGRLPGRAIWRTLIFIPVITSWVVVSYVFADLFNSQAGLVNSVLAGLFGPNFTVDWLQNTWTGMLVIWILAVWKGIGWSMILFLAALESITPGVVDAARVDGAHGLRLWRHIILPEIQPTMTFVLVMLIIGAVQAFIPVYLMTQGGPDNSTQLLLTYTYQQAFSFFDFGYAAALASVLAVALFWVSIGQYRILRARNAA